MCWYSADHAERILQAEVGQRLVMRKVHGSSWAVQESDLQTPRPAPVCLVDNTRVLFRFPEQEQVGLPSAPDSEAVFRMLTKPKRDVFQFADGREVGIDTLPANLVFDVLEIPGKEELSELLDNVHRPRENSARETKRESLLERVLTLF
jgi:hypothetical protein